MAESTWMNLQSNSNSLSINIYQFPAAIGTNYHKCSGLKQHIFIISEISLGQESRHGLAGFCAQSLKKLQPQCQPDCITVWSSGTSSKLEIQILATWD